MPLDPTTQAFIISTFGSLGAGGLIEAIRCVVLRLRRPDAEAKASSLLKQAQALKDEPLVQSVAEHIATALGPVLQTPDDRLKKACRSFCTDVATQYEVVTYFVSPADPAATTLHSQTELSNLMAFWMRSAGVEGDVESRASEVVSAFLSGLWQVVGSERRLSVLMEHGEHEAIFATLQELRHDEREFREELKSFSISQAGDVRDTKRHVLDMKGMLAEALKPAALQVEPEEDLRKYIEFVKSRAERLDFIGMPIIRPDIEAPRVDQMYVSLKAVRQRAVERLEPEAIEERLAEEERLPERMLRREQTERPVEIGEAMGSHRKLVILGKPGSGKSTMMKYIALAFAEGAAKDRLALDEQGVPILIELRDFATQLPEKGTLPAPIHEFLVEHARAGGRKVSEQFFDELLDEGKCVVLLDGLDEVRDETDRLRVADSVRDFLGKCGEKARVVVTSRITGYRPDFFAGGQFVEFVLQDFTIDREIPEFVNKWYSVVEQIAPDASPHAATAAGLTGTIRSAPGIQRLACNPLMLTLIALIHRTQGGQFPERRVKLYDACAKTLLEAWDVRKGLKPLADEDEARRRLESLALWMHNRPSRDKASYEGVVGQMAGRLVERGKSIDPDEARTEAKKFLKDMEERAGLLVERGIDVWGFMHFTFQEYFAACALHKLGGSLEFEDTAKEVMRHIGDPAWEETIRLVCGLCTEEQVEVLVGGILDQEDDIFHSNLFLAAKCLADAATDETPLTAQVEDALCRLYWGPAFSPVRAWAVQGMGLGRRPSTVRSFGEALRDRNRDGRRRAATALGNIGAPEAVQDLIQALADEDPYVRGHAASALGNIGAPEATQHLIQALEDEHSHVRRRAAEALGNIGTPEAVRHLIQAAKDRDSHVRWRAAGALGNVGTPRAVPRLIGALEDKNPGVRWRAARALGSIGAPEAVQHLIAALKDEDPYVRRRAAGALGNIGTPEAVEHLGRALTDENSHVRRSAAWALGNIGTPEAVEHLGRALTDEGSHVGRSAAEALGRIRAPEAVQHLIGALRDEDSYVGGSAAEALGSIGVPEAVQPLIGALKDEASFVRWRAAWALGSIGAPEAVQHLIGALNEEDSKVRLRAAEALGNIGAPEGVQHLIGALKDEDSYVRGSAASALGHIRAPEAVQHLIGALKDENSYVRDAAYGALKKICDKTGTRIYPKDVPGRPEPRKVGDESSVVSAQKETGKGRNAAGKGGKSSVVSSQKKSAKAQKGTRD